MSGLLGSAGNAAKGFGSGAWDGVKSTASGLKELAKDGYALATDPAAREQAWQTTKQVANVAQNYGQQAYDDPARALQNAKDGANRLYSAFDKARQEAAAKGQSAEFWGHAAGRTAFEVASVLIPAGALTKAGKLAEGAEAAGKMAKGAEALKDLSAFEKAAAALAKATQEAADAGYEVMPCGKLVRKAQLAGLTEAEKAVRADRAATALEFFRTKMGKTEEQAQEALNGIDLSKEVEVVPIPPPGTMSQFVRKGKDPGNWFNPDPKQTADLLGLNGDPAFRELRDFPMPKGTALRSTAAAIIDNWTNADKATGIKMAVFTPGGGKQMTVDKAVLDAIKTQSSE